MSRYDVLFEHLVDRTGARWQADFSQIEAILGAPLPASAHRYPAWWANQSGAGHIQSAAWQRAGWKTTKLDLDRRRVTFERQAKVDIVRAPNADPDIMIEEYLDRAAEFAGTEDRKEVMLVALKAYVSRESARALGALGGTMPDFVAPPRRRDER